MRRFESSRQSRVFDFSALQILPPVPSVSHPLLGLQVQSKVSGQVIFVGRRNSLFAQPKRFAHNGLVGGLSPSSPTTQSDENRWSSADDKPVTFAERLNQAEGLPRSHLAARRSRGRWRRV